MNKIILEFLAVAACLAMTTVSHADSVTGDIGYFANGGTFTDSSFSFNDITLSFITSSDGDFSGGTISFDVPGLTGLEVNSGPQAESKKVMTKTNAI